MVGATLARAEVIVEDLRLPADTCRVSARSPTAGRGIVADCVLVERGILSYQEMLDRYGPMVQGSVGTIFEVSRVL